MPASLPLLALAQAVGHARLQRPQLDEAGRGLLGEQPAGLRERRELRVVDGVGDSRASRPGRCP